MKPIIGIVEWPYIDKDNDEIYEVFNDIIYKVNYFGGIPIGIFPTNSEKFIDKKISEIKKLDVQNKNDLKKTLSYCDAIIKPGAIRIYNYERYIYDYCVYKDVPYLGICAGMQLMSNYKNERITKNIKNINNDHNTSEKYCHYVNILEDTLLYEVIKTNRIKVNSKHNYHIQDSGLMDICAYSDDGIIESIYNKNARFQLGIQWHPELLNDQNNNKIFEMLIENAKFVKK